MFIHIYYFHVHLCHSIYSYCYNKIISKWDVRRGKKKRRNNSATLMKIGWVFHKPSFSSNFSHVPTNNWLSFHFFHFFFLNIPTTQRWQCKPNEVPKTTKLEPYQSSNPFLLEFVFDMPRIRIYKIRCMLKFYFHSFSTQQYGII